MAALNELAILIRRFFRLDLGYIHCKWSLNHLSIGNGLPFTGPDASIVSLIHCNVKESVFLTNNGMLFFFFSRTLLGANSMPTSNGQLAGCRFNLTLCDHKCARCGGMAISLFSLGSYIG